MTDPPTASPEEVAHDDICPVCHLLLFSPVRTSCAHILCATCMAQWANTTSTTHIAHSHLDLNLRHFDPSYDSISDLSASCPMCRTQTTAQPDEALAGALEERYPHTYRQRREEEEDGARMGVEGAETVIILIGNSHSPVQRGDANQHDWTFFVRLSRPEVVDVVKVELHPTFRPPRVVLREPPFDVRRLGWGIFQLEAVVVLRQGWVWAKDPGGEDEREREDELKLRWMLDFEGTGAQGRVSAKIRRVERDGETRRTRVARRRGSPVRWPHMDPEFE